MDADDKGDLRATHQVVCIIKPTTGPHRWLLHLRATDGQEDWHLFRVDLGAPEEPPVDLTPLPPGSRVFTVDPLATVPGTVLVTMNKRPSLVDYFLIDVATGEMTTYLPAGPHP